TRNIAAGMLQKSPGGRNCVSGDAVRPDRVAYMDHPDFPVCTVRRISRLVHGIRVFRSVRERKGLGAPGRPC
ncbi:MAG TPA: hypothetical protein P5300_11815, partial [Acidobacteriota bacterium]|nr:hypothetical protein [Acidobacteriota bacterium]